MGRQETIFLNSVFFVLGFIFIFSLLGVLIQTALSHASTTVLNYLRVIGGTIIVIFGVLLILSIKYIIPFFNTEHKIRVRRFRNSYVFSFIFGISFAIGWTPCVGAILGSIYTLAAVSPGLGFLLLMAYSLGLGIPFLIVGAVSSKLSGFIHGIGGFLKYFNIISGLFLIALGLLVVFNYIGILSVFLVGPGTSFAMTQLNFIIAIVAGLLTFLSPCILPLVPAYFSYMVGTTSEAVKHES